MIIMLNNQNEKMKKSGVAAYVVAISLFMFFAGAAFFFYGENVYEVSRTEESVRSYKKYFEGVELQAKAAYVFDVVSDKPLFELNASDQLPLASVTKLMTAVVAEENLDKNQIVVISGEAISQSGDSGLLEGEEWMAKDLVGAMLVSSSNDAAFALASGGLSEKNDKGFVYLMNKKANELGLSQTYFLNPTGLDFSNNIAGSYGSAKDVASTMSYILKNYPDLLSPTQNSMIDINYRQFTNTNKIVDELSCLIGGKTGFTNLAGGNLAVMVDAGFERPIVIVVLGSTEEGRFEDVKLLYEKTLKQFAD